MAKWGNSNADLYHVIRSITRIAVETKSRSCFVIAFKGIPPNSYPV